MSAHVSPPLSTGNLNTVVQGNVTVAPDTGKMETEASVDKGGISS